MTITVSVIIPVYNAERYIKPAVESALMQPEVAEVILVEDKSPDNALEVCQSLEASNDKVRLLQHPDKGNHGAGESRNLGITNARSEYVAFLDADDYYLENRFVRAVKILAADRSIDGVYEAAGSEFENDEAKRRYYATHEDAVATITREIPPEDLFRWLVQGGAGYIHLDGLVVKKEGLIKVGLLPKLRLHQDMVLCIRLAAMLKLVGGSISGPVAIRRLHMDNRITNTNTDFSVTRFLAYQNLLAWSRENNLPKDKIDIVKTAYWAHGYRSKRATGNYINALYYYLMKCFVAK